MQPPEKRHGLQLPLSHRQLPRLAERLRDHGQSLAWRRRYLTRTKLLRAMQPRQAHSQWPLLVSGWHRPTHAVATPCLSHMLSCWAPETTVYFRPSKDTRRRTPVEGHPPRLPRLLRPPQQPRVHLRRASWRAHHRHHRRQCHSQSCRRRRSRRRRSRRRHRDRCLLRRRQGSCQVR